MDYSNYFRIEVEEIVWTKDGASKTVEELKNYGRPFVFFRTMSLPIDLFRNCIIQELNIDDDIYANKLFELGMIDHNITYLMFPNGKEMVVKCYYHEFVRMLDKFMNQDNDNLGISNYSFKTNKYGYKDR